MQLNNLSIWSLLTTLSAIVLFIQGVLLLRILYLTHQTWEKYFLVSIPASVSIWSFYIVQTISNVTLPYGTHFNAAHYRIFATHVVQAIRTCQIQISFILIIFVLIVFIEKTTLPYVHRSPMWVLSRLPQLADNNEQSWI